MNNIDLKWRVLITVIVVAAGVYLLYPPLDPDGDGPIEGKINLGLDLQGGIHMVMDVKTEEAVLAELANYQSDFERFARKERIRRAEFEVIDEQFGLNMVFKKTEDLEKMQDRLKDYDIFDIESINGPEQYSIKALLKPAQIENIKEKALDQALLTIRNRIDELGVREPVVQQQKSLTKGELPRILIQLPGVKDVQKAKEIIGQTALLEFRMVVDGPAPKSELLQANGGIVPRDSKLYESKERRNGKTMFYLLERTARVTGADLDSVQIEKDQYGQWAVGFSLSRAGGKKFAKLTEENMDRQLAIVLDKKVQSAPVIRARIVRDGQITGRYTLEEAENLQIVLRSGALPASVVPFEERTVGPSLGHDSISRGIKFILLGGTLVLIFMVVWYKGCGLVADVGMLCTLIFLLGGLASFKATLTLPGIAGIILTIGMAVDANVLIFERIREEMRQGKTIRTAVSAGFDRAFITIMDANVTTLIAAFVLLQFGIGPIRGFAVTLAIGIISSMFAALFISRVIIELFLSNPSVKKLSI